MFQIFGEKYKSCRGAKVYRSYDGRSKESGFVRFTSETDQQLALVEMNKMKLKGKEMTLRLFSVLFNFIYLITWPVYSLRRVVIKVEVEFTREVIVTQTSLEADMLQEIIIGRVLPEEDRQNRRSSSLSVSFER